MRTLSTIVLLLCGWLSLVGCGSDSPPGIPLISSTLTGEYKGEAFTPTFGFAAVLVTDNGTSPVIGVSDDDISCESLEQQDPPTGTYAAIFAPSLEVGSYSNVLVEVFQNHGNFAGHGTSTGSLEITASTAASVAGTIDFSDTSAAGDHYALTGAFEVTRCP